MSKVLRRIILSPLRLLPREHQAAVSSWLRGRDEHNKLQQAGFVFVTCPKSGRTWLRIMLSRILQKRHGLPGSAILGSSAFNRSYPFLPNVFFTHDSYLSAYTGNRDSKKDYYGKRIILLVRDPRDIAVSSYFQWKYRMDRQKKAIHAPQFEGRDLSVYEYSIHPQGSLSRTIQLMNSWNNAIPRPDDFLLVRYEDMRKEPHAWLSRIAGFIGLEPAPEEIDDAVEFASIEQMKKMERNQAFGSGSRRFGSGTQSTGDAYKVRRGKVGGYRDYFTQEQLAEIDELVRSTLASEFGYM